MRTRPVRLNAAIASLFVLGSACFVLGSVPAYMASYVLPSSGDLIDTRIAVAGTPTPFRRTRGMSRSCAFVKETLSREHVETLARDIEEACRTLARKGGAHESERQKIMIGPGH